MVQPHGHCSGPCFQLQESIIISAQDVAMLRGAGEKGYDRSAECEHIDKVLPDIQSDRVIQGR